MLLFLFDCGGTIVNDPFPAAIQKVRKHVSNAALDIVGSDDVFAALIDAWKSENSTFSFPLASHFLQEEVWIVRALNRLVGAAMIKGYEIPLVAPDLLSAYRRGAREAIAAQPQLPGIRAALEWLRGENHAVGVASNDRAFATRTMLAWAGLEDYMKWIFTSDGFSQAGNLVEKPSSTFFERAEAEIHERFPKDAIRHKIYIGDNEKNDVEAPMRLGYETVRFINRQNPRDATWLDHLEKTSAPYQYDDPDDLLPLLDRIAKELGARV